MHDESRSRGAHIDPADFVRSEQQLWRVSHRGRSLLQPEPDPATTTDCSVRVPGREQPVSVPEGPMAGRFSRVRLQHIWRTSKLGPTEIGYAYFRARRRRRNIADDEPQLSESDQLALSGAFDVDDAALARQRGA